MMTLMLEPSAMSIPVPNVGQAGPGGGRFQFDDGGVYCGSWQEGRAHGYGVCSGPKNVGEYSGLFNFGFEISGVYRWRNGAIYEGRWQNGKRHGFGVEYNGKWVYKGEWSQGFKGRYGVKGSSNSAVKYEGTWAAGLQDGYGCETYSDGGYYQGHMYRGLRHGYGVRKSAPYGDSQLNKPANGLARLVQHSNSLQSAGSSSHSFDEGPVSSSSALGGLGGDSRHPQDDDTPKPEDGFKPNIERTFASKNGFVLVSKPLEVPLHAGSNSNSPSPGAGGPLSAKSLLAATSGQQQAGRQRRGSLSSRLKGNSSQEAGPGWALLRGLRLRRQKSTSDLVAGEGPLRGGGGGSQAAADSPPALPFTLSPEELDISDPSTFETYMGEWQNDKRNGHGVCERSDGLRYAGQWHNDMKCGYGCTTFKDGTSEEGKYKNNILITDSRVKRLLQIGGASMRQRVDDALKMAQQARELAIKRAEIADTRAATARDKADLATTAALEAERDSKFAYDTARRYSGLPAAAEARQQQQQQQHFQYQPQGHPPQLAMDSLLEPLAPELGPAGYLGDQFGSKQQLQPLAQQPSTLAPTLNQADPHQVDPHRGPAEQGSLQMRRISQMHQHHQQIQQTQRDHLGPAENLHQDQRSADQHQQRLGPGGAAQLSHFGGAAHRLSPAGQQQQARGPNQQLRNQSPGAPYAGAQRTSADPFGDLFEHYRSAGAGTPSSSGGGGGGGAAGRRGRPPLGRQTSLDACPRAPSAGSRLGAHPAGPQLLRRARVSSLDQADHEAADNFRHLVTSGELRQGPQPAELGLASNSYIHLAPGSSAASSASAALAGALAATPSPDMGPGANPDRHLSPGSGWGVAEPSAGPSSAAPGLGEADYEYPPPSGGFAPGPGPLPFPADPQRFGAGQLGRALRRTASLDRRPSRAPDRTRGGLDHCGRPTRLQPAARQLSRKRSLQARYEPSAMANLMSREQAAALSHAQREQRRLEAELAESRAKRPLLHLCLTLKSIIASQKLLILVIIINFSLTKLFNDLILAVVTT